MPSTETSKNIRILNGGPLDAWWGPYANVAAACAAIPNQEALVDGVMINFREGKKVGIKTASGIVEYYWRSSFKDSGLNPVFVDALEVVNSTAEPAFEFTDDLGFRVATIEQDSTFKIVKGTAKESYSAPVVNTNELNVGTEVMIEDSVEFIASQEDATGYVAWGITKNVNSLGKRILKGITLQQEEYASYINKIALTEIDIYTACNNIGAWNQNLIGYSLNPNAERFLKLATKVPVCFDKTKELTFNLASRRYFHPEPQNGNPQNQSNYLQTVHTEDVSVKIIGDGVEVPEQIFNIKHRSTLASVSQDLFIPKMFLGDSVTNEAESRNNRPFSNSPSSYWGFEKYFFEQDKLQNGNAGHKFITVGSKSIGDPFDVTVDGVTSNGIKSYGEGYSGWTTRDLLYGKTFAQTNRFHDPDKVGTIKFSLPKYLSRYRTMDDNGNRLALGSPSLGTLVTDPLAWDVCTPKIIHFQMGFNDVNSQYATDLPLMISTIKADFPNMVIAISLVGAAGTYYPEKWGFDGCEKDVSFLEPMDIVNGFGYGKRLNDKMFDLIPVAKANENKASNIFFLPNFIIQPTGLSIPHRIQSEPFGKIQRQPYATSSFAYHPNNLAHGAWGYHNYSFTKYLCSQGLIQ